MNPEIRLLLQQGDQAVSQKEYVLADTLYKQALHDADVFKDEIGYYHALKKLADLELLLNRHEEAAKLYLAAYFEAAGNDNEYATSAFAQYKLTQTRFFTQNRHSKKTSRQQLEEMRLDVHDILIAKSSSSEKVEWTKIILKRITITVHDLLERKIYRAISKLGNPRTKFCVIGLGSFGRREMSTHSDIEWAIVVKDTSPANIEYFTVLSKALNIRLIKFAETDINDRHAPGMREVLVNNKHPVPKGLSMDQGFKTPPGKPNEYRLIDSPDVLAALVDDENFDKKSHLIAAMISSSYLFGDETLFKEYKAHCRKRLSKDKCEALVIKFMETDLKAFNIDKSYKDFFENKDKINCKNDLYRPFNRFIESLSLLSFGVEDQDLDSFSRIDKLLNQGVISGSVAEKLKYDFAMIEQLRMRLYLFHNEQREKLTLVPTDHDFPVTDELAKDIEQILNDLKIIFEKMRLYVASRDKKCFYDLFAKYEPQVQVAPLGGVKQSNSYAENRQFFNKPLEKLSPHGEIKRTNSCPEIIRTYSPTPRAG